METILITGSSGFIGFHTAKKLLERGETIIGYDNENDYYDVNLKFARREILEKYPNYKFYKGDLEDFEKLKNIFETHKIDKVFHPAAQAGVRYSLENPGAYIQSNLVGFYHVIELAKQHKIKNFVYASSSSVYGMNKKQPFSIEDKVDHPISLYAATKKSNELIAHTYSHLYELPTTGLRFFTVQGAYGRPDMAYFKFTKAIFEGKTINIYNHGKMERDFTDIEDIVRGVIKCIDKVHKYEVFNLGNDSPTQLGYMIELLEKNIGIEAKKNYIGMQAGDVKSTWADIEYTKEKLDWQPTISIEDTIEKFVKWYKEFYGK